jgi:glycosyltransferase involved in cell wall biosynthesis
VKYSVCFTNFGPYHLARLRALAERLTKRGDQLLAIEVADHEQRYPWTRRAGSEPFAWITLFSGRAMEEISRQECVQAMLGMLDRERPDALGIVGYSRPESMAALRWARKNDRPTILMSESQEIDHPRVWWKEAVKRNRVRKFSAGLVGGPRHRDYLVKLGMPGAKIALGYNAVDNAAFAHKAEMARREPTSRKGLPDRPYFLAVNRFVPEKNLPMLIRAFARYRLDAPTDLAWDLVLSGGGPGADEVEQAIVDTGLGHAIHRPGFLQADQLAPWLAHAGAFVHPSLMEPWGLVVNEAAACGLPLIVSNRAGCVETLVPETQESSGCRFDPFDEIELTDRLAWMAGLPEQERRSMGRKAASIVADWGPERFAQGTLEALELAEGVSNLELRSSRRRVRT